MTCQKLNSFFLLLFSVSIPATKAHIAQLTTRLAQDRIAEQNRCSRGTQARHAERKDSILKQSREQHRSGLPRCRLDIKLCAFMAPWHQCVFSMFLYGLLSALSFTERKEPLISSMDVTFGLRWHFHFNLWLLRSRLILRYGMLASFR